MKLPHAERAMVERAKLTEYLLNAAHPDNGGKAAFFQSQGFHPANWHALADALVEMARDAEVVKNVASRHGEKYILAGRLRALGGKRPLVRSVWIVDQGATAPRLVTAYPQEE
jgi:hypothetical protein